jgi:hypothetical protein
MDAARWRHWALSILSPPTEQRLFTVSHTDWKFASVHSAAAVRQPLKVQTAASWTDKQSPPHPPRALAGETILNEDSRLEVLLYNKVRNSKRLLQLDWSVGLLLVGHPARHEGGHLGTGDWARHPACVMRDSGTRGNRPDRGIWLPLVVLLQRPPVHQLRGTRGLGRIAKGAWPQVLGAVALAGGQPGRTAAARYCCQANAAQSLPRVARRV